jgi:hypothetical protein
MRAWKLLAVSIALAAHSNASPLFGGGNDTCDTATPVSPGIYAGLSTFGSWQFPTNIYWEWDWFRVTVPPGQQIDVDAQITGTSANPPVGWYTFMHLYEYGTVSCAGTSVMTSFANHVSVANSTTVPKDYAVSYYAGVNTSSTSVTVYYDLIVRATTLSTAISYCPGAPNSLGLSGTLSAQGTNSVSANDLVFSASNLPASSIALLASGTSQTSIPFGDGVRCIGGALRRLYLLPVSSGQWTAALDIPNLPPYAAIVAGDLRYFQLYYRDPFGPLGTGFNLTNAMCVAFVP